MGTGLIAKHMGRNEVYVYEYMVPNIDIPAMGTGMVLTDRNPDISG
jgi:hypothetical protein